MRHSRISESLTSFLHLSSGQCKGKILPSICVCRYWAIHSWWKMCSQSCSGRICSPSLSSYSKQILQMKTDSASRCSFKFANASSSSSSNFLMNSLDSSSLVCRRFSSALSKTFEAYEMRTSNEVLGDSKIFWWVVVSIIYISGIFHSFASLGKSMGFSSCMGWSTDGSSSSILIFWVGTVLIACLSLLSKCWLKDDNSFSFSNILLRYWSYDVVLGRLS